MRTREKTDLEELWIGRIDDFLAGHERLRPAALENRMTHSAGHNERSLEAVVEDLAAKRAAHVGRLEELTIADFGRIAKHPRLEQSMRLVDSVYFAAEHDDHHLAAARQLLRNQ